MTSIIKVDQIQNAAGTNTLNLGSGNSSLAGSLDLSNGGVYLGGTGAANYLDDYEEGTWTVTWSDGTNTSSSTTTGYYTKVGNKVTAHFLQANLSSSGMTSSNDVRYSLPFAVANFSDFYPVGSIVTDQLTFASSRTMVSSRSAGNVSYGIIRSSGSNVTDAGTIWSYVASGATDIFLSITYLAA